MRSDTLLQLLAAVTPVPMDGAGHRSLVDEAGYSGLARSSSELYATYDDLPLVAVGLALTRSAVDLLLRLAAAVEAVLGRVAAISRVGLALYRRW